MVTLYAWRKRLVDSQQQSFTEVLVAERSEAAIETGLGSLARFRLFSAELSTVLGYPEQRPC